MSLLTNECSICFENFKNSDVIFTTSCGHLHHQSCMEQWRRNGTSCPECRVENPSCHKIYLSFEDRQREDPEKIQELELKLQSSNEKNQQLNVQMQEVEFEFMQLQEQFTAIEEEKKNLQEKLKQMNDSEANFLHLQGQYTEKAEHIKYLEEQINELQLLNTHNQESPESIRGLQSKIQELTIQNEELTKELRLKGLEIESLKNSVEADQYTLSEGVLSGRIKILEQRLKHYTMELNNEISNNSKLIVENLKLQTTIEHLKAAEKSNKSIQNKSTTKNNKKSNQNNENPKNDILSRNQTNNITSRKIFIKDLPVSELTFPLENIIINLAEKMDITMTAKDMDQVKHIENSDKKSSKIQLMVEFKTLQLKTEFVAKKNILKNFPSTNTITIGEYMDDELHALLMYAKENLRNKGYNHVFYKNNMVFAKKHRTHPQIIRIHDKAHVDSLVKKKESMESAIRDSNQSTESAVEPETRETNRPTESTVDENYYQL